MKTNLIMLGALASALAMTTACSRTEATAAVSAIAKDQETPFPGGAKITPADLTATPAALPAAWSASVGRGLAIPLPPASYHRSVA